jgi:hypothetical protein
VGEVSGGTWGDPRRHHTCSLLARWIWSSSDIAPAPPCRESSLRQAGRIHAWCGRDPLVTVLNPSRGKPLPHSTVPVPVPPHHCFSLPQICDVLHKAASQARLEARKPESSPGGPWGLHREISRTVRGLMTVDDKGPRASLGTRGHPYLPVLSCDLR